MILLSKLESDGYEYSEISMDSGFLLEELRNEDIWPRLMTSGFREVAKV